MFFTLTIPARHVMQIYNSADQNIDSYASSARRVKPVPRRGFPGGLTTESRAILASPLVVSGDGQPPAVDSNGGRAIFTLPDAADVPKTH